MVAKLTGLASQAFIWDWHMATIRTLKGHIDLNPFDSNSFRCSV